MNKLLLFLSVFLHTVTLLATDAAKKCCICETGNYPKEEIGFFYQGCRFWLDDQKNCSSQWIVEENTNYSVKHKEIGLDCINGSLKIGFVGHWFNSQQTLKYIDKILLPAMKTLNVDVSVENTACLAMENASSVQEHIVKRSQESRWPAGKQMVFAGNQASSVGIWEKFMGSGYNFTATAATFISEVFYPSCKTFENRNCLVSVQKNEQAHCRD
ncbi:MAG TPA: hypothetical protein PLJ21_13680, partial [Pseudobdellovibrionaceae bacterium]|nr:hypothetical protein [Pseudobdellovibrionaceae bacterium]